jgi:hypothetical protein
MSRRHPAYAAGLPPAGGVIVMAAAPVRPDRDRSKGQDECPDPGGSQRRWARRHGTLAGCCKENYLLVTGESSGRTG